MNRSVALIALTLILVSCDNYFQNDYKDNSPTSGKLKVYYDEGIHRQLQTLVYTFEALYSDVFIETVMASESAALLALLSDSCEAVMIPRRPGADEMRAFASRRYKPDYSAVALTGVAVIASTNYDADSIAVEELKALLSGSLSSAGDETGKPAITVLFGGNNSSVLHYMKDSVLNSKVLSSNCNVLQSSEECINYVAANANAIALIDFAWLSDVDDSLTKANAGRIKFLKVENSRIGRAVYPNQSTFKLGEYPFTRTVFVIRKTGEFSLAKGFESFVAGPKGQTKFLKQGLLPARQQERAVSINVEE
jgi:phosphate transport system substrate-binding protein